MKLSLPTTIGYGHRTALLEALNQMKKGEKPLIELDWAEVSGISPAGLGMLACLFDTAVEHHCRLTHEGQNKAMKNIPVVQNLNEANRFRILPKPMIHNQILKDSILEGQETTLNLSFIEKFIDKFQNDLSDDLAFSCRLIVNELMQNSIDHSGAERYYLCGGIHKKDTNAEVELGILDMGVSIQAKLRQKYEAPNDEEYLDLAFKEGTSTRRARPGGLGLFHTLEHLRNHEGTLIVMSGGAQIIRYFKSKTVRRRKLKFPLHGTWCLARFPIQGH